MAFRLMVMDGMEKTNQFMKKIMRKITYIFGLLMCVFFFSCEKEEFITNSGNEDSGNDFYINPEDTAGIIVPEGYSLVIFPGNQAMTRAGSETRIQHLQYIIYQQNGSGEYIQYEANKIIRQDLSSWPLKSEVTSLPKNHTYKVVFLGNVDKSAFGANQTTDVLTGTGKGKNFTNARILLPSVEFSNNNMYFFAKAEFNTNATAYVPITLKRIVSRNDITKEELLPGYTDGVTDDKTYKAAYWKQMVREKMKDIIFTGEKSAFRYQVAEALKKNMIYPLVYVGLSKPEDATTIEQYYSVVKQYNTEWDSYKPGDLYLGYLSDVPKVYPSLVDSKSDYANNLCIRYAQYLYDTFVKDESVDPQSVTKALEAIFTDNIDYIVNNISQGKSIDLAVNKTITAIEDTYNSGVLIPWRLMNNNKFSVVNISADTPVPGAVDFDLNTDATHGFTGEKYYRLNNPASSTSDKYISIVSLGEPQSSTNNLKISKIYAASSGGTNINYNPTTKNEIVSEEFTAGGFKRNIRNVTTQNISGVVLLNPQQLLNGDKYKQKIEVNYYHVFQAMNPVETTATSITIGNNTQSQFTIENVQNAIIKVSGMQSYILNLLNNSKYPYLNLEDETKISFPFVTFTCPDLSSTNLNVTTEWTTKEVQ